MAPLPAHETSGQEPTGSPTGTTAEAVADIRARIARGDAAGAERVLETAQRQWPSDASLRLTRGELLAARDGPDAAASYYADLIAMDALLPWPAGRLQAILPSAKLAPPTVRKAARAVATAKLDERLKQGLLQALLASSEEGDRASLLQEVAPVCGIFRFELRLAIALADKGRPADALALLDRAYAEGRITSQGRLLRGDLIALQRGLPEGIEALEHLKSDAPDYAETYRRLAMLHQRAGNFDRAADLLDEAIATWPADWMLLYRLNRMPIVRDRLERLYRRIKASAQPVAARDPRFRYQFALAALDIGDIDEGMHLLSQSFEEPVASLARPVARAVATRMPEEWRRGIRLRDDRTAEVQIVKAAAPAQATVVITAGPFFGNLPIAFLDSLLARHNLNAIYLRDFRKRAFLTGVAALGADEAATIAALQKTLADLAAPRTIVMGSSSGGFSALRYGALLEADHAVSFAGPTLASSFFDSTTPSVWNPNYLVHLLLQEETDLPFDLVPLLQVPRRTRFHQVFGADNEKDVAEAQRIANLPNVLLKPVDGVSDHLVVDHLIASGAFDTLLDEIVRG